MSIWADLDPTGDVFGGWGGDADGKIEIKFERRPDFAAQTGNCAAS